jgi:catechol 2,3-dioxygenase-like lactoylglutathione lyase family enzyme
MRNAPQQNAFPLDANHTEDSLTPELPGAVPEIPVSNIDAAAAYYRDAFGFNVDWVEAEIALAGVSRDHCRLFLAGPGFRDERSSTAPVSTWLNLSSKDEVDDLHRAWRSTNAILLSAPESKPWGLHDFTASDLDGNRFRVFYDFATPDREQVGDTAT